MAQPKPLLGPPNSKKCRAGSPASMGSAAPLGVHCSKLRWHFLRTWVLHLPEDTQGCIWKMVYGAVVQQIKSSVVHSSMTTNNSSKLVTLSWPRVQACVLTLAVCGGSNYFGMPQKYSMLMPPPLQRGPSFVNLHTTAYYWTACLVPGAQAKEDLVRVHGWHTHRCTKGTHHFRLQSLCGHAHNQPLAHQYASNAPCLWSRQHKWCHLAPLALIHWLD